MGAPPYGGAATGAGRWCALGFGLADEQGGDVALVPTTLDEVDYWDLEMFVSGDPHAAWTIQRREAPVWWHDRPGGEPFWSVARYDDVKAVHSQPTLYSSQAKGIVVQDRAMLENPRFGSGINPMIHTDPPRHAPLRKLIAHNFTPRSIAELEAQIRGYAVECLEEAADKGEVDFVVDIAHRIPAAIALSLMGVPRDAWDRLAELEHQTVTRTDPEFAHGADPYEAANAASLELGMYFYELLTARAEDLGDDLLSQFLKGRIDDEELPVAQVVAEAGLLLAGGHDTTRAAASAGAMLPLMEHRDQLEALCDDPGLLPVAVEEFIRWSSPITSEARTLTADAELGGHQLHEGDRVVMWSPSANRDEAVFEEPFRYDVRRQPNRHLAFAHGEHFCLGAHLARLTLKVEFEELFARFSGFEQVGEAVRVRSNFVGGLKHLPVRLTPR